MSDFYPEAKETEKEYIDLFFDDMDCADPTTIMTLDDFRRYELHSGEVASEIKTTLPCYLEQLEPFIKNVWLIQQTEIMKLRKQVNELAVGQQSLSFNIDDIIKPHKGSEGS